MSRDKDIEELRQEIVHWKAVADNAVAAEELAIERLTLCEIDLDLERKQRQLIEKLLETEKALVKTLEDIVRATATCRSQA